MQELLDASISDTKQKTPGKWPVMLAAGAMVGVAGNHANANIIYTNLNTTIDSAGVLGPTSTTVRLPSISTLTGSAATEFNNVPAFIFTASTTNGVQVTKPAGSLGASAPVVVMTTTHAGSIISLFSAGQTFDPTVGGANGGLDAALSKTVGSTLISADGSTSGLFTESAGLSYIGFFYNSLATYHAGWVGFQTLSTLADGNNDVSARITQIAVEDVTAQEIQAGSLVSIPEPASLGLLAMGSIGLLGYRRRNRVA